MLKLVFALSLMTQDDIPLRMIQSSKNVDLYPAALYVISTYPYAIFTGSQMFVHIKADMTQFTQ